MKKGLEYAFSEEKRALDLIGVVIMTVPAFLAKTVLGHLLSEQPDEDSNPLLWHPRIGADGLALDVLKLRTLDSKTGEPFGKVAQSFRRYGVDELPQAYHIFRNEMSVVGNRPIQPHEKEAIFDTSPGQLVDQWKRIVEPTKPGLLSTFAIYNHGEDDKTAKMIERGPMKLDCDIRDVIDGSLTNDMTIIGSAFAAAVRGET